MIREIWEAWKRWWVGEEPKSIESLDIVRPMSHGGHAVLTEEMTFEEAKQRFPEYAVDGKPRRKPWSIRKKELEAAAKQKRRQRDEYRSEA